MKDDFTKYSTSVELASRIPAVLRIGVTGHRNLEFPALISDSIRKVIKELDELLKKELKYSPHTFMTLSPLAEGSDRLVAREVLNWSAPGGCYHPFLEVVLPMPEEVYVRDFKSEESVREFKEYLARARLIKVIDGARSREDAFEIAGQYVVQGSDILIAIWNGKAAAGQGGTADIVDYARKTGHQLVVIDATSGEITYELDRKRLLAPLRDLDAYNGKSIRNREIEAFSASRDESFLKMTHTSGLPEEVLQPVERDLVPKYARASILAKRYQRRYFYAGIVLYVMAMLAVTTVATHALFEHDMMAIIEEHWHDSPITETALELIFKGLEIVQMLIILLVVGLSNYFGFHRQWIDYRFLAERIRAAIFFTIAGIRYEPLRYPRYLDKNMQSDYWIVKAFSWIWYASPVRVQVNDLQKLKNFLKLAWIDDQKDFYHRGSQRQERKNERWETLAFGLFILTLLAATIPFIGEIAHFDYHGIRPYLYMIGIVFPACGASVAGYLALRQFQRNAERYEQMVPPMQNFSRQIELAGSRESLIEIVEEANELMLRENQDWRINLLSQKLKP
ncbi:MAG: hypothetical protein A4E28_03000 [Methanocella sp. PtaU1.Bin125]|nr:MAG: hypothetical protein A4E28_03000 [Methanocella sp. PtaU1.Bin125]